IEGGGIGDWSPARARMSAIATRLADTVLRVRLADPMSGYFMTSRALFEMAAPRMSGEGYKVLLDYVASSRTPLRCLEIPYNFRRRVRGTSKVDEVAIVEYGLLLADKLLRG